VCIEVFLADVKVPVEEEKQLFLHQVDFGAGESERLVASDVGVFGPVLVLWGGVVEEFGGEDECCEEDAMDRTS
jgi:hypothetical protein